MKITLLSIFRSISATVSFWNLIIHIFITHTHPGVDAQLYLACQTESSVGIVIGDETCESCDTVETCLVNKPNPLTYLANDGTFITLGADSFVAVRCFDSARSLGLIDGCECLLVVDASDPLIASDICNSCTISDISATVFENYFDCSNRLTGNCVGLAANGNCISNIETREPTFPPTPTLPPTSIEVVEVPISSPRPRPTTPAPRIRPTTPAPRIAPSTLPPRVATTTLPPQVAPTTLPPPFPDTTLTLSPNPPLAPPVTAPNVAAAPEFPPVNISDSLNSTIAPSMFLSNVPSNVPSNAQSLVLPQLPVTNSSAIESLMPTINPSSNQTTVAGLEPPTTTPVIDDAPMPISIKFDDKVDESSNNAPASNDGGGGGASNLIIGIAVGVVGCIALAALVAFLLILNKMKQSGKANNLSNEPTVSKEYPESNVDDNFSSTQSPAVLPNPTKATPLDYVYDVDTDDAPNKRNVPVASLDLPKHDRPNTLQSSASALRQPSYPVNPALHVKDQCRDVVAPITLTSPTFISREDSKAIPFAVAIGVSTASSQTNLPLSSRTNRNETNARRLMDA